MAGRRTRSGQDAEPSPAPSRRSNRSNAGPNGDNSPSIAPLPSENGQPVDNLPGTQEQATAPDSANAAAGPANGGPHMTPATGTQGLTQSGLQNGNARRLTFQTGGGTTTLSRSPYARMIRPDLGAVPARPLGPLPPTLSGDIPPLEGAIPEGADNTFIWGTTVSVHSIQAATYNFLSSFRPAVSEDDDGSGHPKYIALLLQCLRTEELVLNLDTADVRECDRDLYKKLVSYPREVLPLLDLVAAELAAEYGRPAGLYRGEEGTLPLINVRPFNLETPRTIRDLNPEDIDTLVSVQGMVTRTSTIIPELRTAFFRCQRCQREQEVLNENGRVQEPELCPGCNQKFTSALVHNMCAFNNKQLVKMQEKPNDIPEGETPHSVSLYVYEGNVDVCRPGDRVTVTGIYRAVPMRVNPQHNTLHAVFRTHLDALHVSREQQGRLFTLAAQQEAAAREGAEGAPAPGASQMTGAPSAGQPTQTGISGGVGGTQDAFFAADDERGGALGAMTSEQVRAREAELRQLACDPQLMERLVASFAPNIWEMEDIKKGLLAQLFGGLGKTFPGGRVRGEINVLLVGDPSVSKSQLLSYVHALAPRGIYTSGKGSSAVGLTAYVSKDPETRELVLESGALVLSDRGVCCIDEFDKMSDSARSTLHEAMEQQTVSVAKAGLISTLNARTSVCACANPIGSRYNPSLSVSENINLPPTLLTRFDLIYLVLDKFDEEKDRRLARHLISLYHEGATGAARQNSHVQPISTELLRDYIAYARARVQPRLSDEAAAELITAYQSLRRDGRERKVVVATPRQLESIIRLSEALARMKLDEVVSKDNVKEAVRLWYTAMSGSASGEHGGIDLENITTGVNARTRAASKELPEALKALLSQQGRGGASAVTSVNELLDALRPQGVTREMLVAQLRQLSDVLVLDERTGVVRPRRAIVPGMAPTGEQVEVA